MGNHNSRRDHRKWEKQGGKAANALSRVEELRGPSVDSYDKLIAWLAEMAENDNVELDTSVFVSQLNRVCGNQPRNNHLSVSGNASADNNCQPSGEGSSPAGKRSTSSRQNSTSCDSHVSRGSSDATQRHKNSTRSDDFLDPKSAWRSEISTRQNTFSDDMEEGEDSDVKNASVESIYSSTDRESELGSMSMYDSTSRQSGHKSNFTSCSPLLRMTLARMLQTSSRNTADMPCSSSTGHLNMYNNIGYSETRRLPQPFVKRRSVSLLNLSRPVAAVPRESIPKFILTPDDGDDEYNVSPSELCASINKTTRSETKPLSLTSERKKAKLERQFSLHSDSNLSTPSASNKLSPVIDAERTDVSLKEAAFLDDALLDGNIADILFSVEALWPKS